MPSHVLSWDGQSISGCQYILIRGLHVCSSRCYPGMVRVFYSCMVKHIFYLKNFYTIWWHHWNRMVLWYTFLWSNRPLFKDPCSSSEWAPVIFITLQDGWTAMVYASQEGDFTFIGSLYRCGWSGRLSLSGILHTLQASVARMSKLHGDSMGTSKCVCNTHLLGELHASARGTEACSCHENFLK